MLDSEPNSYETDIDKAARHEAGAAPAPVAPTVPAALFQPPQVLFQPPAPTPSAGERDSGSRDSGGRDSGSRDSGSRDSGGRDSGSRPESEGETARPSRRTRGRSRGGRVRDGAPDDDLFSAESADAAGAIGNFRTQIDHATKFIPTWVKVAVAIALGLGTMVGWKRIVVTVGEKIGKQHLTYGQGASAELVAMATIGMADVYGLPVSTTHVLSSGVAGTMAANGSGLQWGTVRSLVLAWVLTLPASIVLAGGLYWVFRNVF